MDEDKYKLLSKLILKSMVNNKKNNKKLNKMLSDNLCSDDLIEKIASKEYFSKITKLLDEAYLSRDEDMLLKKINNYSKRRKRLHRIIALLSSAAVLALAIILFPLTNNNSVNDNTTDISEMRKTENIKVVKPTLIIDNTNVIVLDNKGKSITHNYPNTQIIENIKPQKHHLIVPFGSTYSVLLDDSSEVTLNSNSELIFPSKFNSNKREVILKGEAFFNIKKDSKSFIVITQNSSIKVYGTSFNINARNENLIKTVLVSGSVAFTTKNTSEQFIKPSQMAIIDIQNNKHQIINVNTEDYIAWKDGYFRFINTNFSDMIIELNNWYGIAFKYNKEEFKDIKVNFSISRSNSIDETTLFIQKILNINIKKEGGEFVIY